MSRSQRQLLLSVSTSFLLYAIYSYSGYVLRWKHSFCSYQYANHIRMTPSKINWNIIKKSDCIGVPVIIAVIGTMSIIVSLRKLYLKVFEIPIKTARAAIRCYNSDREMITKTIRATTAVMAAQTCFGWLSGECNYELLTLLLRNEWGFRGVAHSDYWVWNGDNLRDLALLLAGSVFLLIKRRKQNAA